MSQLKVLQHYLPVYAGSSGTELQDFFEVQTAGCVCWIAVARNSSKPNTMLQRRLNVNKGLDHLCSSQGFSVSPDMRHSWWLVVNVVNYLRPFRGLSPEVSGQQNWQNFQFMDRVFWGGQQSIHYRLGHTLAKKSLAVALRIVDDPSNRSPTSFWIASSIGGHQPCLVQRPLYLQRLANQNSLLQKLQRPPHCSIKLRSRRLTMAKTSYGLYCWICNSPEGVPLVEYHSSPHSLCLLGGHSIGLGKGIQLAMQLLFAAVSVPNNTWPVGKSSTSISNPKALNLDAKGTHLCPSRANSKLLLFLESQSAFGYEQILHWSSMWHGVQSFS